MMKIAIGNDHSGLDLKQHLLICLEDLGHTVVDVGTSSTERTHSAIYAVRAADLVVLGEVERAILVCGSGVGMSIVANKINGIRAVLCHDEFTAKQSREHNDTNVMALGAKTMTKSKAGALVRIWLDAQFVDEDIRRYRLGLINKVEQKN